MKKLTVMVTKANGGFTTVEVLVSENANHNDINKAVQKRIDEKMDNRYSWEIIKTEPVSNKYNSDDPIVPNDPRQMTMEQVMKLLEDKQEKECSCGCKCEERELTTQERMDNLYDDIEKAVRKNFDVPKSAIGISPMLMQMCSKEKQRDILAKANMGR